MTEFSIDVKIDPAQAQAGAKATDQALQDVVNKSEELNAALRKAFNLDPGQAKAALSEVRGRADEIGHSPGPKELGDHLAEATEKAEKFNRALESILAAFGLHEIAKQAFELVESFETVEKRLQAVTVGTEQLDEVTARLFAVANESRATFEQTAEVYIKTSIAAQALGRGQEEAIQFTELLNKAIASSGASAAQAEEAIHGLSFAFQNGAVNGRQLQTVLSVLPEVGQQLAQELGVSRAQLKELANQGLITGNVLFDAFLHASNAIEDKFAKSPETVSQALNKLHNGFQASLASVNEFTHATSALSTVIDFAAQHAGALEIAIGGISVAMLGTLLPTIAKLTLALAANPFGLFTIAVTGTVAATVLAAEVLTGYVRETEAATKADIEFTEQAKLKTIAIADLRDKLDKRLGVYDKDEGVRRQKEAAAQTEEGKAAFAGATQPLKTEIEVLSNALQARERYAAAIKVETELRKQGQTISQSEADAVTQLADKLDVLKAKGKVFEDILGPQDKLRAGTRALDELEGTGIITADQLAAARQRLRAAFQTSSDALATAHDKEFKSLDEERSLLEKLITARGAEAEAIKKEADLKKAGATDEEIKARHEELVQAEQRNEYLRKAEDLTRSSAQAERDYTATLVGGFQAVLAGSITTAQYADALAKANAAVLSAKDPVRAQSEAIREENDVLELYINSQGKSLTLLQEEQKLRKTAPGSVASTGTSELEAQARRRELLEAERSEKDKVEESTRKLATAEQALQQLVAKSADNARLYTGALIDNTRAQEDNARASGLSGGEKAQLENLDRLRGSQIEYARTLQDIQGIVKSRYGDEALSIKEIEQLQDQATVRALEGATSLEAGFTRAFAKMRLAANDFASVAERVINAFAAKAEDALFQLAQGGTVHFKDLARSLLAEIEKIIIKLLVLQAIEVATGTGGGGGITNLVGAGTNEISFTQRAEGGPVAGGRTYLVGEHGPELYTPGASGNITPNNQLGDAQKPQVNIQVTNVSDPSEVSRTIQGGTADHSIINVLQRNRAAVKRVLG